MNPLKFVSGIAIGQDHVKSKKNCQDALLVVEQKDLVVAVVADGIGDPIDSPYSEVGSRIGVNAIANQIASRLNATSRWRWNSHLQGRDLWDGVQKHTLNLIEDTALGMGGSRSRAIIKHFLFTIVGMVVTPDQTLFFGAGDGNYFLNGKMYEMFAKDIDNNPPCIVYNLVGTTSKRITPEDMCLRVRYTVSTKSVLSAMVATDGIEWLLKDPKKLVPGTKIPVGGPEDFWTNKEYYNNPDNLGRRLNLLATEKRRIDWKASELEVQPAILNDDLAMVVASRI